MALVFAAVTPFNKPFLKMHGDNNIKRAAKVDIFVVHEYLLAMEKLELTEHQPL